MRPRHRKVPQDRAFTLVELMVVVSIASVVVAGLGSLLVAARTRVRYEHASTQQPLAAQTVLTSLRSDLRAAPDVGLDGTATQTRLTIFRRAGRSVVYLARNGWLQRHSGREVAPLARVRRFVVRREGRSLQLDLELSRDLGALRRRLALQVALAIGAGPGDTR